MDNNRLPAKAMHCRIQGKRNPGRQPNRWIDGVKEDLTDKNISMWEALDHVYNRDVWRRLVTSSSSFGWRTGEKSHFLEAVLSFTLTGPSIDEVTAFHITQIKRRPVCY